VCLHEVIAATNTNTRALETTPSAAAHLHLKGQAQKGTFLQTLKKVTTLTSYKQIYMVYFVLKLHTRTLGTSEIYLRSCKNGILPLL